MQDVALLAVRVLHERDTRGAIRIVLDLTHRGRNTDFVALEVDTPIHPLVATAATTHRDVSVIVATAALGQRLGERLLGFVARDLGEIRYRTEARPARDRFELTSWHSYP